MKKTDPKNIIGKIELFINDLEQYVKEDNVRLEKSRLNDHLRGYYAGRAQTYAFCAKWLKMYLEGNA